jgi:hypothetical protein
MRAWMGLGGRGIGTLAIFPLFISVFLLTPTASAGGTGPLGLDTPFLAGSIGSVVPIDIGADGVTDLIVSGSLILNGAEEMDYGVHLLVRQPDGRWVHRQDIPDIPDIVEDFDGDGLQDLLVTAYDEVSFLRQTRDGIIEPVARYSLHSEGSIGITSAGDGLLLAIDSSYSPNQTTRGTLLRLEGGSFQPLWTGTLCGQNSWWMGTPAVVRDGESRFFVTRLYLQDHEFVSLWSVPITESGPGEPLVPLDDPRLGQDIYLIRSGDRSNAILFSASGSDTLYKVVTSGDSVQVRPSRIEGLSGEITSSQARALPLADGVDLAVSTRDTSGAGMAIIHVSGDAEARCVMTMPWQNGLPDGFIRAPNGEFEFLVNNHGVMELRDSSVLLASPDVPFSNYRTIPPADLDGDGKEDVVFLAPGSTTDKRFLCFCRQIDVPPWFEAPQNIREVEERMPDLSLSNVFLGDLDGDNRRDALLAYRYRTLSDSVQCVPIFHRQSGWEAGAPVDLAADDTNFTLADFDGDGSTEVVYSQDETARVLFWKADGTPDPSAGSLGSVTGTPEGTGDFDGDGLVELVTDDSSWMTQGLSIWRTRPRDRLSERLWRYYFRSFGSFLSASDLNGDNRDEALIADGGTNELVAVSFEGTAGAHEICRAPRKINSAFLSFTDLDADGKIEAVSIESGGRALEVFEDLQGPITESRVWSLPLGVQPTNGPPVWWHDVDRDGDPDLVFIGADGIRVFPNETIDADQTGRKASIFRLASANPGRNSARVAIRLPQAGLVSMGLYDVTGRALWKETQRVPGDEWFQVLVEPHPPGGSIPAGVYFLKVTGGGRTETRRVLLGF